MGTNWGLERPFAAPVIPGTDQTDVGGLPVVPVQPSQTDQMMSGLQDKAVGMASEGLVKGIGDAVTAMKATDSAAAAANGAVPAAGAFLQGATSGDWKGAAASSLGSMAGGAIGSALGPMGTLLGSQAGGMLPKVLGFQAGTTGVPETAGGKGASPSGSTSVNTAPPSGYGDNSQQSLQGWTPATPTPGGKGAAGNSVQAAQKDAMQGPFQAAPELYTPQPQPQQSPGGKGASQGQPQQGNITQGQVFKAAPRTQPAVAGAAMGGPAGGSGTSGEHMGSGSSYDSNAQNGPLGHNGYNTGVAYDFDYGGGNTNTASAGFGAETGMGVNSSGQTFSNDSTIAEQNASFDSDSSPSSSSSKIICTAMNEAYGFGSFRNRIWLAYSAKHLKKEHEIGYHAMFLPLIKMAYKDNKWYSKPVRAVLESLVRHRSNDLRAEMRGCKRDRLGQLYRFIFEPLCFLVGKLKVKNNEPL